MPTINTIVRAAFRGAAREIGVYPCGHDFRWRRDDVMLVSYPKSGNTWFRMLIANLLYPGRDVTLEMMDSRVPDIYKSGERVLRAVPSPRFIKSHECFDPRYRRVVYIVRDPRSVVVSYYHYEVKIGRVPSSMTLADFVDFVITDRIDYCGTWDEHVRSWLAVIENPNRGICIRYEDARKDTVGCLRQVVDWCGLAATDADLQRAVTNSSFERMQERERRGSWSQVRSTRKGSSFFRRGETEAWRSELTPELVQRIEQAWGNTMRRFGYELTTN